MTYSTMTTSLRPSLQTSLLLLLLLASCCCCSCHGQAAATPNDDRFLLTIVCGSNAAVVGSEADGENSDNNDYDSNDNDGSSNDDDNCDVHDYDAGACDAFQSGSMQCFNPCWWSGPSEANLALEHGSQCTGCFSSTGPGGPNDLCIDYEYQTFAYTYPMNHQDSNNNNNYQQEEQQWTGRLVGERYQISQWGSASAGNTLLLWRYYSSPAYTCQVEIDDHACQSCTMTSTGGCWSYTLDCSNVAELLDNEDDMVVTLSNCDGETPDVDTSHPLYGMTQQGERVCEGSWSGR